MPIGGYTILEFDRPTDGERVRVGVRVRAIHTEGTQWGWRPAIHVDLLDRVEQVSPRPPDEVVAEVLRYTRESRDSDSVHIESLSASFDETAEDLPAAPVVGAADGPPRLSRSQAAGIALGSVDPDAGRALRGVMAAQSALPAMYATPVGRRDGAATPFAEAPPAEPAHPDREARILANSPAAYLTSGRHRAGMVQDFSRGGMFMAVYPGEELPAVGAIVRVEFAVPDRAGVFLVGLNAEVRWIHAGESRTDAGRGAGLAITGFDRARGREVYEEYVNGLVAGADRGEDQSSMS